MVEPVQTTPTQGDPNGVPRPLDEGRLDRARHNSGIIIGEEPTTVKTTAGTTQDEYKTAFVKVYQDAGVIGVAMLTLLTLCLIMAVFSSRILKMYATLVNSNNALLSANAQATEKLASAHMALTATITGAVNELRREHDEQMEAIRENGRKTERLDDRTRGPTELLSRFLARQPLPGAGDS